MVAREDTRQRPLETPRRPGLLGRRPLLAGAGLVPALASMAGCGLLDTRPESREERRSTGSGRDDPEAPMLAQRVRAGELPPVRHRIPQHPLVVHPVDHPGTYGGTWRNALLGAADTGWLALIVGYEPLVRWDRAWRKIIPGVAESFEVNASGTEYVFRLRKGLRWSDGEPLTAEDVAFAQNDVHGNEDLFPSGIDHPATAHVVDEHTVRLVTPKPDGLLLQNEAATPSDKLCMYPRHYLKKFHPTYNKDLTSLVREKGLDSWTDLFWQQASAWNNPNLPTLNPWVVATPLGSGSATQVVFERNPYYWKTDPKGRQLPYIDRVVFDIVNDEQTLLLKATRGDVGIDLFHITDLQNKPVLARNQEQGNYWLPDLARARSNKWVISLNLTHKDPVKRSVFQNRDFRIGLSYAIDREEIIKTTLASQGKPFQAAPAPDSPLYDEELGTQYTRHDPAAAKRHLDRAGYTKTDADGYRLGPDGKRITIAVELAADPGSPDVGMLELVRDYWKRVGIEMRVKNEDRSLFYARKGANEHDAAVWSCPGVGWSVILDPRCFFPVSGESNFAIPWATWFGTDGEAGEEPPDTPLGRAAKKQMQLYRTGVEQTPDIDAQEAAMAEILRIAKEEFWAIGIAREIGGYAVATKEAGNIPGAMVDSWVLGSPGIYDPCHFYMKA